MQNTEARKTFEVRCLRFGVNILKLTERFPKNASGKHLADQLMRSGTSVGANLREAQAAQSRADFIHKMQVSLKEAREADYWLGVIHAADIYTDADITELQGECQQLTAILAQSIITAKGNIRR
jgi:four helix bundle protein